MSVKYRNNSSRLISGSSRRHANSSSANNRVATNPTPPERRPTSSAPKTKHQTCPVARTKESPSTSGYGISAAKDAMLLTRAVKGRLLAMREAGKLNIEA